MRCAQGFTTLVHGGDVIGHQGVGPGTAADRGIAANASDRQDYRGASLIGTADDAARFRSIDNVVGGHGIDYWRAGRGGVNGRGGSRAERSLVSARVLHYGGKAVGALSKCVSRCECPVAAGDHGLTQRGLAVVDKDFVARGQCAGHIARQIGRGVASDGSGRDRYGRRGYRGIDRHCVSRALGTRITGRIFDLSFETVHGVAQTRCVKCPGGTGNLGHTQTGCTVVHRH